MSCVSNVTSAGDSRTKHYVAASCIWIFCLARHVPGLAVRAITQTQSPPLLRDASNSLPSGYSLRLKRRHPRLKASEIVETRKWLHGRISRLRMHDREGIKHMPADPRHVEYLCELLVTEVCLRMDLDNVLGPSHAAVHDDVEVWCWSARALAGTGGNDQPGDVGILVGVKVCDLGLDVGHCQERDVDLDVWRLRDGSFELDTLGHGRRMPRGSEEDLVKLFSRGAGSDGERGAFLLDVGDSSLELDGRLRVLDHVFEDERVATVNGECLQGRERNGRTETVDLVHANAVLLISKHSTQDSR